MPSKTLWHLTVVGGSMHCSFTSMYAFYSGSCCNRKTQKLANKCITKNANYKN